MSRLWFQFSSVLPLNRKKEIPASVLPFLTLLSTCPAFLFGCVQLEISCCLAVPGGTELPLLVLQAQSWHRQQHGTGQQPGTVPKCRKCCLPFASVIYTSGGVPLLVLVIFFLFTPLFSCVISTTEGCSPRCLAPPGPP